jgi:hypothetical protein
MQNDKSPKIDDLSMSAIRTGIGVNDSFWDDFLLVINNSEGLSDLLDVPTTKISTWHEKIKHALEKVTNSDSDTFTSKNKKLIKTGLPDDSDPDSIPTEEQ